jgi:penicillin-binding protein 2
VLTPTRTFFKKVLLLSSITLLSTLFIIGRLFQLQVYSTQGFHAQSQKNFIRYEKTTSLRGNILDSFGKIITTNKPVTTLFWKGTGTLILTDLQKEIIEQIEQLTGHILQDKIKDITKAEKLSCKVELIKDLSFDELSKVTELFSSNPNLVLETEFIRVYPYKSLASHVLGYLGNKGLEIGGKMGLERLYEHLLRGKDGITQKVLNSFGKNLSEKEVEESLAGQDITVTLDLSLQRIAEMLFPKDKAGVFLLMDSSNGALRVALSHPDFDPNLFLKPLEQKAWKELQERKPFLNRIFNASYPPGSIFKLVTLGAALEHNIIQEDTLIDCKGFTKLGKRGFRCHKRDGHRILTINESLAKSCNILFYDIGRYLDIDALAEYATQFGFGQNTGSVFDDSTGLIPTREWKQRTKGERWWLGETFSASIGQSFLLTTPIQIARMIASIETGYLINPRILENTPLIYEPLKIKHKTRKFLQNAMHGVTLEGTARTLNKFDNFRIHAKTSTAQTSTLDKRKMGTQFLEHGWLVANFSYKGENPLTMVVLVENAGNSRMSLMVAKSFLKAYEDLMELRKKHDETIS